MEKKMIFPACNQNIKEFLPSCAGYLVPVCIRTAGTHVIPDWELVWKCTVCGRTVQMRGKDD